jgi:ABC-type phosphate transport system substrate-binding protein
MKMRDYFGRGACAGVTAALAFSVALSAAQSAQAADCSTLTNPVYVTGSSAVKPFLAKVAAKLNQATPAITVVYKSAGSCDGVGNMSAAATDATSKVTGTGAIIFDNDGKDIAGGCDLPIAGATVDIGVSDVYASTCQKTVAVDVGDFHGPNQTMTFVVHPDATIQSISAEAAYLVYGFGAASHPVAPWNDATEIFLRSAASGTQGMIGTAIKVPPAKWLPTAGSKAGSGDVRDAVYNSKAANKEQNAIGILAADVADAARDKVKVLAYQHYDQTCGYLPDSSATKFDKLNTRDGHYYIWGPLHMYARKTGANPSSTYARTIIEVLQGKTDLDGLDLIQTEAKSGVVPDCAMMVSRDEEVGALSSYQPDKMCGCKYENEANGSTTCTACDASSDCPSSAPACNYGFCEVQ